MSFFFFFCCGGFYLFMVALFCFHCKNLGELPPTVPSFMLSSYSSDWWQGKKTQVTPPTNKSVAFCVGLYVNVLIISEIPHLYW